MKKIDRRQLAIFSGIVAAAAATWLVFSSLAASGNIYYVDYDNGVDTATGMSPEAPWKHTPGDPNATDNARTKVLQPGDKIQFKGGVTYRGQFSAKYDGAAGLPITYSGTGWGTGRAIIDGSTPMPNNWKKCSSIAECPTPAWNNTYVIDESPFEMTSTLMGNKNVESGTDSLSANQIKAFRYTIPKGTSGQAGLASLYIDAGTTASSVQIGIYSDSGSSSPKTLMATATLDQVNVGAWNKIVFPDAFANINNLTTYWVAVVGSGGNLNLRSQNSNNCSETSAATGALGSSWTAGSKGTACNPSLYINTGVDGMTALYEGDKFGWTAQDPDPVDPYWNIDLNDYRTVPVGTVHTNTQITDASYFTQSDPNYWKGAYIAVYHRPNVIGVARVTSFDPATHTIRFTGLEDELVYGPGSAKYAMLNHAGLISREGEYSINPYTEKIFYWPRANPNSSTISLRAYNGGIDTNHKNHIVIEGFQVQKFTGGAITNKTQINAAHAVDVVVRDNYVTKNRVRAIGGGVVSINDTDDLTIDGNIIEDNMNYSGVSQGEGTNLKISNNKVARNTRMGIWVLGPSDVEISGNEVKDGQYTHANGISVYQGSSNVKVFNNKVFNHVRPITAENSTNVSIYNNFLDGIGGQSGIYVWGGMGGMFEVVNNTILGSVSFSDEQRAGLTTIFRNNIVEQGGTRYGTHDHNIYLGLSWWQSGSWTLREGEKYEPDKSKIFADPVNGDFKLKATSPAIDAGYSDGMPATDITGGPRVDIPEIANTGVGGSTFYDIGAYEYTTAVSPPVVKEGDINGDGHVSIIDLSMLLTDYGKSKAQAINKGCDINGDNTIDIIDLSKLLSKYGT